MGKGVVVTINSPVCTVLCRVITALAGNTAAKGAVCKGNVNTFS